MFPKSDKQINPFFPTNKHIINFLKMTELRKKSGATNEKIKRVVAKTILIGALITSGISCSDNDEFRRYEELDRLHARDVANFSWNAVNNAAMRAIFQRREEDVASWMRQALQGGYFLNPNTNYYGGGFHPTDGRISFGSLQVARYNEWLRAHEQAHRASWCGTRGNRGRVGFHQHAPGEPIMDGWVASDEAGFNEGVTQHFAVSVLMGGRNAYLYVGGHRPRVVQVSKFRELLKCDETLWEAFLFDPNILIREVNRRSGDDNAWRNFIQAMGNYCRFIRSMGDPTVNDGQPGTPERLQRQRAELSAAIDRALEGMRKYREYQDNKSNNGNGDDECDKPEICDSIEPGCDCEEWRLANNWRPPVWSYFSKSNKQVSVVSGRF